ncbi:12063_t:CDS:2, partial [Entrophospora sp. SA101]
MEKKQTYQPTRVRKFLRPDATPLSPEDIEEIKNAPSNIPNAGRVMCKKYRIGMTRYRDIINNRIPREPTEEWLQSSVAPINIPVSVVVEDTKKKSKSV